MRNHGDSEVEEIRRAMMRNAATLPVVVAASNEYLLQDVLLKKNFEIEAMRLKDKENAIFIRECQFEIQKLKVHSVRCRTLMCASTSHPTYF